LGHYCKTPKLPPQKVNIEDNAKLQTMLSKCKLENMIEIIDLLFVILNKTASRNLFSNFRGVNSKKVLLLMFFLLVPNDPT
jgi:hypothetical protein